MKQNAGSQSLRSLLTPDSLNELVNSFCTYHPTKRAASETERLNEKVVVQNPLAVIRSWSRACLCT